MNGTQLVWALIKILVMIGFVVNTAAILTWLDRRQGAMMQDRVGPNRAVLKIFGREFRLAGLLQAVAPHVQHHGQRVRRVHGVGRDRGRLPQCLFRFLSFASLFQCRAEVHPQPVIIWRQGNRLFIFRNALRYLIRRSFFLD